MAGMIASPRNRSRFAKDNPNFDDGFYQYIYLSRSNRKAGRATGGRLRRRALRAAESRDFRRNLETY